MNAALRHPRPRVTVDGRAYAGSLECTCHEARNLSPRQILRMAEEVHKPVRVTQGK